MEKATVIFLSLVSLCGVRDAHADTSLTAFTEELRRLDGEMQAMKVTVAGIETRVSNKFIMSVLSLKEELTNTFIPVLMKGLVKQAITDILKEGYIGDMISGRVRDEVSSLKAGVHNTKTQLQAVTQQLRHVVRERDTYRESLEKLRGELSKNIHSLQLQLDEAVCHLRDEMLLNTALRQDLMTSSLSQVSFTTSATTFPGAAGVTPSPADCEDLHDASRRGKLEEVKRILSLKVYVNCRRQSRTPVMASAGEGHIQVVELLVGKGADVSLVDGDGNNTLHWACYGGHLETVKFVLSLNVVDIESRGIGSWTPVMVAARRGHMEVVELLVSKGADVSLVDVHGYNILHLACWGKHVKMVKFVLSLNMVDIDSRGYRRWTPMMVAARRGNRKVVALLLAKGADMSLVDEYNDNILHLACMGGHVNMVKFVLSLNVVDIDCRGFDSQTPVMGAARQGHGEVVELLVNEGADVRLVDDLGDNILHHACAGGNMKTVKLVLSLNVVDVDARNKRVVKLLESRGAQ